MLSLHAPKALVGVIISGVVLMPRHHLAFAWGERCIGIFQALERGFLLERDAAGRQGLPGERECRVAGEASRPTQVGREAGCQRIDASRVLPAAFAS